MSAERPRQSSHSGWTESRFSGKQPAVLWPPDGSLPQAVAEKGPFHWPRTKNSSYQPSEHSDCSWRKGSSRESKVAVKMLWGKGSRHPKCRGCLWKLPPGCVWWQLVVSQKAHGKAPQFPSHIWALGKKLLQNVLKGKYTEKVLNEVLISYFKDSEGILTLLTLRMLIKDE